MRYVSVCDGIGAAHAAWQPLGFECAWTSEIDAFPAAVVDQRWGFANRGDMTMFQEWDDDKTVDILVGGTPCQSFSVAGLRKGLHDPRGGLMLTFLEIARRYRPRWVVWENVPGVLSSNGGRDFGSILGGLGELGYGWAYRVLDAQWFGVAQRRRRVFVVGCLGDWRSAAEVLFEPESLCGDSAPSREKGQEVAKCLTRGAAQRLDAETETMIAIALAENTIGRQPENGGNGDGFTVGGPMYTLNATGVHGVAQPIAFEPGKLKRLGYGYAPAGLAPTLRAGAGDNQLAIAQPTVLMDQGGSVMSVLQDGTVGTLRRETHGHEPVVMQQMAVRRLTPVECERLQGFPDNYTNIAWRKQPESPDGPRYKALGNSMAVPVMKWIGEQINGS